MQKKANQKIKSDFKNQIRALLLQDVTDEEAKFLKQNFGLPRHKTDKGVLLLASLYDLAVKKGSVPAAKELLSLNGAQVSEEENGMLEQLVNVMQEV